MAERAPGPLTGDVTVWEVVDADLPIFFEQQLDPEANQMAAFTARDRDAFTAHWTRIRGDQTVTIKTILCVEQGGEHRLLRTVR